MYAVLSLCICNMYFALAVLCYSCPIVDIDMKLVGDVMCSAFELVDTVYAL